ncbi:type III-B CRISPR module RAMP protein Cmr1 [Clostridium tagluense]|uniref:type III-B CRISPR module RAMP protein Cmr1 n=1 Tax=Clostridium tagluense TaxID=360422 RepID=UPI001C0BD150|nr:type III-B CRISPR module RAMP protein Cmr1 [Clostridium tagluense]MBU3127894.1 type III-B CRISPR module RAMP protein Cmr1 [Clostridium tagluense]
MKIVEITLEILTPMFSFGDDSKKDSVAEFRITELKSLMRSTFRELFYFEKSEDMKEKEGRLFGNTERKSPVAFKLKYIKTNKYEKHEMLPHRSEERRRALTSCLDSSRKIKFYMIISNVSNLELYIALLIEGSIVGALGKRSRKGFGSFRVNEIKVDGNKEYDNLLKGNPIEIFGNIQELLQNKEYKLRNNNLNEIKENNNIIEFNLRFDDNNIDYPYVKNISVIPIEKNVLYSNLLNEISKLTHNRVDDSFIEEFMGKEINKSILGNYKTKKRFASPVCVTFSENNDEKYLIIKEVNHNYVLKELGIVKNTDKHKANMKYINNYIKYLKDIGKGKN